MNTKKHRFGDRRDGRWVRDVPPIQTIMANLMPNRADSEVYLSDTFDATNLMKYLERKNSEHPEYKTTIFHCLVLCIARMIHERPVMNRFVQGRRIYQRDEISISFVCKRRFTEEAEEALMVLYPKGNDNIDSISRRIVGDVGETRRSEKKGGGIDGAISAFSKIPRLLMIPTFGIIRMLDFWGLMPKALTDGDINYTTVLCTNLGSIKCPSIYHHLNNYGTNSIVVAIGALHKAEVVSEDGQKEMRDVIDLGVTLDERIGDGFYFARSLKLVHYILEHPELLDKPLDEASGFDYK